MSMNPPPMYAPPEQPQKKGPALWIVLSLVGCGLLFCIVLVLGAILFPVFAQARQAALTTNCMSHLKVIGTGMAMYATDYDERLPSGRNWMDVITPYHVTETDLHCPAVAAQDAGAYGYAFNRAMSTKPLVNVVDFANTPVAYDSTLTTRNAMSDSSTLPVPGRHYRRGKGNNVLFTDFHVGLLNDGK